MKSDEYLPLVKWGSYRQYSGPYTLGKHRYRISSKPTFRDKVLAATSATEGGSYGGVNAYDRCILTVGAIQKCEAATIYGVSDLLGACAERNVELLQSYLDEMPVPCTFERNARGRWRFFHDGVEVVSKEQQRALFLGGASGYKGQWSESQKEHARRVCAVMATLWQEETFRRAQDDYNGKVIFAYATSRMRKILFAEGYPTEGAEGALRAGFITFAVNNPARADKYFHRVYETEEYQEADADKRLVLALRALTFDPGIAIYPARYNAIRPVLEREFGIDLPDFAEELRDWYDDPNRELFPDARSIQAELIALGYDLGPAGADGKVGPRTRAAIEAFERENGLPNPDGHPDVRFTAALAAAQKVRLDNEEQDAEVPPTKPDDAELVDEDDRVKPVDDTPEPAEPPEEPPAEPPAEPDLSDEPPVVVDPAHPEDGDEDKATAGGSGSVLVMILLVVAMAAAAVGRMLACY